MSKNDLIGALCGGIVALAIFTATVYRVQYVKGLKAARDSVSATLEIELLDQRLAHYEARGDQVVLVWSETGEPVELLRGEK